MFLFHVVYITFTLISIVVGGPRCRPRDIVKIRQRSLVGFVEYAFSADNFRECYSECLNAWKLHGFVCHSGMIYYHTDEENCFLNNDNKDNYPTLFANETEGRVDYFEPCKQHQEWLKRKLEQIEREYHEKEKQTTIQTTTSTTVLITKKPTSTIRTTTETANESITVEFTEMSEEIRDFEDGKAIEKQNLTKTDSKIARNSTCSNAQLVKIVSKKVLVGSAEKIITARTFSHCFSQCVNSLNFYGFVCRSGMMYYENRRLNCMLNSGVAAERPGYFRTAGSYEVDYFEPGCKADSFQLSNRKKACSKFSRIAHKVLVGFAEAIMDTTTVWECIEKCKKAKSTIGLDCKSGMFFEIGPGNCILNKETRKTQSEMFVEDRTQAVVYFEAKC